MNTPALNGSAPVEVPPRDRGETIVWDTHARAAAAEPPPPPPPPESEPEAKPEPEAKAEPELTPALASPEPERREPQRAPGSAWALEPPKSDPEPGPERRWVPLARLEAEAEDFRAERDPDAPTPPTSAPTKPRPEKTASWIYEPAPLAPQPTEPTPKPETAAEPETAAQAEIVPPTETETAPEPGFVERGRIRRRARYLQRLREVQLRDIGGFVVELHRFGRERPDLVLAKVEGARRTDAELRALQRALGESSSIRELREAGIGGACDTCGAVHGSEDRYCASCGEPLGPATYSPDAATDPGAHGLP